MKRRVSPIAALVAVLSPTLAACGGGSTSQERPSGEERPFPELAEAARGTEVNLHMYSGDDAINAYVDDYAVPELKKRHDV